MPTRSSILRQRREDLRLSQSDLGWLASISRATVGNVERNDVEPEPRTVTDITLVLGWDPDVAMPAFTHGDVPANAELMPIETLVRILGILRRSRHTDATSDSPERYQQFMRALKRASGDIDGIRRTRAFGRFSTIVQPYLLPKDRDLAELFTPEGPSEKSISDESISGETDTRPRWREAKVYTARSSQPTLSDPLTQAHRQILDMRLELSKAHEHIQLLRAKESRIELGRDAVERFLESSQEDARAFQRLPPDVQKLLKDGWVIDRSIFASPRLAELKHIVLTVKPDDMPYIDARDVADAVWQLQMALLDAYETLTASHHENASEEKQLELEPDTREQAALTDPGNLPPTGQDGEQWHE